MLSFAHALNRLERLYASAHIGHDYRLHGGTVLLKFSVWTQFTGCDSAHDIPFLMRKCASSFMLCELF